MGGKFETWMITVLTTVAVSWGGMVWHTGEKLNNSLTALNGTLFEYMVATNERIAKNEVAIEHMHTVSRIARPGSGNHTL